MREACGGNKGLDGNRARPAGGGAPDSRARHGRRRMPRGRPCRGPGQPYGACLPAGHAMPWRFVPCAGRLPDQPGRLEMRCALQALAWRPFCPSGTALRAFIPGLYVGQGTAQINAKASRRRDARAGVRQMPRYREPLARRRDVHTASLRLPDLPPPTANGAGGYDRGCHGHAARPDSGPMSGSLVSWTWMRPNCASLPATSASAASVVQITDAPASRASA